MYVEIINTHPHLEIESDLRPGQILLRPAIPSDSLDVEGEKYRAMVTNEVENISKSRSGDLESFLNKPDRPFLILPNKCGPFKSAYAETNLNHILLLNQIKNPKRKGTPIFDPEYLDNYITNS